MKQKNKPTSTKIRIADLILIIASIVLIFLSFVGFFITRDGDWLTATFFTLIIVFVAAGLIYVMIYAKRQTNHVMAMRILEGGALVLFMVLAFVVAIGPVNHAFTMISSSKQLSGAIDSDISQLDESITKFFKNEDSQIGLASGQITKIYGRFTIENSDDRQFVERTMKLKSGEYYSGQTELENKKKDYEKRFKEALHDSKDEAKMRRLVENARKMQPDVDAGFFFSYPSIATEMDSLSRRMARLQNEKARKLNICILEKNGSSYIVKQPLIDYKPAYTKSEFSRKLHNLNEDSILGILIGLFFMILLLTVYLAEPRKKSINPKKNITQGLPL